MDNENKYIVLDYLYNFNLEHVKQYSESIYNSLNIGWQNYICNKEKNKSARYKDKIEKNLDKLEKKDNGDLSFIKSTKGCLEYLQKNGIVNYKFKNTLLQNINTVNSLTEYFRYILNKYDEIIEFEERKERKSKQVNVKLPYKINTNEYYVIDKDGYYNYHVKNVKGSMVVTNSSLKAEKVLYKNALKDNKEIFKEINKDIKLSPFEKKRRIYIENIFNLDKLIKQLYEKKIDITYPLEKYFIYSDMIVDGLYHEVNRFILKRDIFDYIMNATIENFNYEEVANNYAKCVKKVNVEFLKLDDIVKNEFIDDSKRIKSKDQYTCYKNIDGIVPSVGDIYSVVNKMVIKGLVNNYQDNHLKMDEYIKSCTKYMNEKEIVEYYREYKNILISKTSYTECFIILQKSIVDILINRFHYSEKVVFDEYIKEEKIF